MPRVYPKDRHGKNLVVGSKVTLGNLVFKIEYFTGEGRDLMAGGEYGEFFVDLLTRI